MNIYIWGHCRLKLGPYYTHWLHFLFLPYLPLGFSDPMGALGGGTEVLFVTTEYEAEVSVWRKLLMYILMVGLVVVIYSTAVWMAITSGEDDGWKILISFVLFFVPLVWALDSKERDDDKEPRGLNWRTPIWAVLAAGVFLGLMGLFLYLISIYLESH